jgi:hypothetical protein
MTDGAQQGWARISNIAKLPDLPKLSPGLSTTTEVPGALRKTLDTSWVPQVPSDSVYAPVARLAKIGDHLRSRCPHWSTAAAITSAKSHSMAA